MIIWRIILYPIYIINLEVETVDITLLIVYLPRLGKGEENCTLVTSQSCDFVCAIYLSNQKLQLGQMTPHLWADVC